jgi:hypothetical protein
MRLVKSTYYLVLLLAMLLPACASNRPNGNVVYEVGGEELVLLGHRLGFRVAELGMSDYSFTRGSRVFHVWAPSDMLSTRGGAVANAPLMLSYRASQSVSLAAADQWNSNSGSWARAVAGDKQGEFRSTLLLNGGVTLRTVELHFRRFVSEIDSFERQLKSQN